uniref:Uncharacterized protein n=1 Tax=Arundo donax TaxID=35708 RepID=A0A0A9GFX9_ARUDO
MDLSSLSSVLHQQMEFPCQSLLRTILRQLVLQHCTGQLLSQASELSRSQALETCLIPKRGM